VLGLRRLAFGPLTLGTLPLGAWRPLTPAELARLRRAAAAAPPAEP
jgi:23S rRNA pseudouridine2605 synthase